MISKKGMSPIPAKVKAIQKLAAPGNIKDLQCFLGMVGYYRSFIEAFDNVTQPLFAMLRKDAE